MADRTRRERLLTFLLLPAVVVAVLVLLGVTIRNSLQLEKLREKSVVEATYVLASDNAGRLEQRIIEQDNAVRTSIRVDAREDFGNVWLSSSAQQTPTVRAVLLLDLSSRGRPVVAFASRGLQLEDEQFRRLLVNTMLGDMELNQAPRSQLRHLHGTYQGHDYLISYWQKDYQRRRYLLVAWHSVPLIVHKLFTALYSNRDPQSRVNVVDSEGRIVYGQPLSRGGVTLGRPFQTTLYKWHLNATIISAEALGEALASRQKLEALMVAVSLLVVIAGLIVVVVAVARERRLSNLKSDFVSNVSHELKTPLSSVRMFGELLQSGRVDSDAKRRQYLEIINNESERLSALIENVLDFARAERGKAAYEFAERSLAEVVERAAEVCRSRAGDTVIELRLPPDLPLARIDEHAIEVATTNLIDNALKYAPGGKIVVVELKPSRKAVEIRVTDEGPGIPRDDRKRIFDRFVRGRAATEKHVRGSGIGLALVKQIADAHGGKAWVEPADTGGSTFVLAVKAGSRPRKNPPPEPPSQ
jgi:two-component system phosphate regulon sensor histidine kinase PhoR